MRKKLIKQGEPCTGLSRSLYGFGAGVLTLIYGDRFYFAFVDSPKILDVEESRRSMILSDYKIIIHLGAINLRIINSNKMF